ncbi:MAG: hypothetical protein JW776_16860 [Candidatus Lokiarchaeota archaeon]|nr:hypothetical protein [Candidatus Lokiarchaeota archaeon]
MDEDKSLEERERELRERELELKKRELKLREKQNTVLEKSTNMSTCIWVIVGISTVISIIWMLISWIQW